MMPFRKALNVAFVAVVLSILSGCYVPLRFDAEIEFNRQGAYKIIYDGYLVELNIYKGLQAGTLSRKKEKERAATAVKDLKRDRKATKVAEYLNQGRLKFTWEKEGDLLQDKMIAFLRRNQQFITLRYVKTKRRVYLKGMTLGEKRLKQMLDMGLTFEGQIRMITDARVLSHDADIVKRGPKTTYVWNINPRAYVDKINKRKAETNGKAAIVTFPNMEIKM